ncbi:MAG: hypothetical protein AMK70_12910 [Nitrospira bacterium SG8_35_1]|nr:MAG: hypothetical protein AMK70_12910 [Nitrospira bacterium SG8_35_1]
MPKVTSYKCLKLKMKRFKAQGTWHEEKIFIICARRDRDFFKVALNIKNYFLPSANCLFFFSMSIQVNYLFFIFFLHCA